MSDLLTALSPQAVSEERLFGCQGPGWPKIARLGLSKAQLGQRMLGVGGSDANIILSGVDERVHTLWLEKRGEAAPASLNDQLAVMLGCWTEDFNRQWWERQMALPVTEVGLAAISPTHEWRRATLDGLVPAKASIWEAKHVNAFAKPEEILTRYMPQLQHNMAVLGLENAILSVIYGNHKWESYEVAADWLYQEELFTAEWQFWECVKTGRRPVAPPPLAPPKPVAVREVNLQHSNVWAAAATDWIECRASARKFEAASKTIKELIEPDVSRAFGHGIEARRSKSGAITIRELAK